MVWSWLAAEKKEGERVAVVGFVRRVVAAAMGCFFGCFRIRDSHSHLISTSQEHSVSGSKNALSSLFLSDGKDDALRKGGEGPNPLLEELDFRELKDEAKFLKACGTLLETPIEIRNASRKWADISVQIDEEKQSNFNSRPPNASAGKLKLEKQPDDSPTPLKISEDCVTGASSLAGTPSSCMTEGHNTGGDSISSIQSSDIQNATTPMDVSDNETHSAISSVSPGVFTKSVQCKNKSVRFECESDRSAFSSESSSQHTKQPGSADSYSVSKASPYPTPLKLTDEMQTPGTVFPAYLNNMAGEKTIRIRSQYVYSVLNPIEYPPDWKELVDENSDPNHLRESVKPNDEATMISTQISGMSIEDLSVGKDREDEASLSSWFKQYSANEAGKKEQPGAISGENIHFGRTPGDRPILGTVAAHWHVIETPRISAKWWDGNGIPNSTNKYKEDQKVSWHATPFEERLEKALSEETIISQRKPIIGTPPVEFDETEESDTAMSDLQSSANPKPVVSF
ncbi:hypothetical protein CDL12_06939 [Handroanthus impetiginosus]|uniref:Protein JASON n=1 Tax=Handroanthus impetiginosus TaxID=429701 RepID=A0A2G9HS41_9LAMI|nr:hypothetical protein CDL12_06939 [Handroanthus impetiginosus]